MLVADTEAMLGGEDCAVVAGRVDVAVAWGGRNWLIDVAGTGGWANGAEKLAWGPTSPSGWLAASPCGQRRLRTLAKKTKETKNNNARRQAMVAQ